MKLSYNETGIRVFHIKTKTKIGPNLISLYKLEINIMHEWPKILL